MTTPEEPQRRVRRSRVMLIVAAVLLGALILAMGARLLANAVSGSAALRVEPGVPVSVEVPRGASARDIAAAMEQAGVVRARDLERLIKEQGLSAQLQAGIYHLETLMSPEAVVSRLLAGPDVRTGTTVSIREGLTIREVLASLAEQTGLPVDAFEKALTGGSITSSLMPGTFPAEVDPLTRWEGLLFPAKYEITEDATPAQILTLAAGEMEDRVAAVDWTRLDELGVSRYEALTVASLVQREAGADVDRPLIASVIYNRLAKSMPLQLDVTVIYALGENPGRVLHEHLQVDSPWNTYRNEGLPPTPIATIQAESLEAAADPADSDYLFFIVISEDGKASFSRTYEEHQRKVEEGKANGVLP